MSLPSFNKMMKHTITLRKRQKNAAGDFSDISATIGLKGFVQYGNNLIENEKGEKILSTAIVFLKDNCGIDINHPYWRIDQTLPYTRSNMEVLRIDPIDHPLKAGKTHHFEIMVR
jgi:hypothetical protein